MNSFSIRAIDKWNNLTDDIVNSSTVLSFKTMYDRYMGDQIPYWRYLLVLLSAISTFIQDTYMLTIDV